MKIAIVHDYLNQFGGAERVVETLHECFPDAPIYTSIYLPENMPNSFRRMDIRTSFMQKLPSLNKHFKKYLLLYPYAFERFDLSDYDVTLSSSSAWAKGVVTRPEACHICYCYTPMRWVWNYEDYVAREDFGWLIRKMLPLAINRLGRWDLATTNRVDCLITISNHVAERIRRCYNREPIVIHPPVNTSLFKPVQTTADYFLIVSRLNTYKRIDLVIEVLNELKIPLKIIGDGPYRHTLKHMAGLNVTFLGKVSDSELAEYYAKCKALIFPGEEDFGLAPVEAQSAGRPVIAYAKGGALETVVGGETGIFFKEQTPKALKEALKSFEKMSFDPKKIREHAKKFDKNVFISKLKSVVEEKYREHQSSPG